MIGDPTGRNVTRPALSREELEANAKTYYTDQAFLILDPGEDRNCVQFHVAAAARRRRDDQARGQIHGGANARAATTSASATKSGQPIAIHEFLYPLAQGYDSVALNADVELGGTTRNSTCWSAASCSATTDKSRSAS